VTPEEFLRRGQAAQRAVDERVAQAWHTLYDRLPDLELVRLHRAFTLDRVALDRAESGGGHKAAFVRERLAYIEQVLQQRGRETPP
jgi:hypothetical protein